VYVSSREPDAGERAVAELSALGRVESVPAAAWDEVLDLDVEAPLLLTRAVLPLPEAARPPAERPLSGERVSCRR
jgi:NAD(P)-dependent dehydrogenase (short-subunit alcohol dehydrogenase family)